VTLPTPCNRLPLRYVCGALLLSATPQAAAAQQFAVDDAAVVAARACQVEAWHGEAASWVLPACGVVTGVELTAGAGWIAQDGARRDEYVVQGKWVMSRGRAAAGAAGGIGLARHDQVRGGQVTGAFAYVPVSITTAPADVHLNLGWQSARGDAGAHTHALTWGSRIDVPVQRHAVIAELFGENTAAPEYQAGVRLVLIAERLATPVGRGDAAAALGDAP
jgi:hypothetical protein